MSRQGSSIAWPIVLALWYSGLPLLCQPTPEESHPPSVYVAKGACPFEGCVYREWIARRALTVLDRPGGSEVARINKGDRVQAITGEVHCRPLRVVADRNHPESGSYEPTSPLIRKGQVYYLLHYLGEGQWKVWFQGKLAVIGGRDPDAPKPKTTWWAKVKTARGVTGWVVATGNFDGQDMLAQNMPAGEAASAHLL